MERRRRAFLFTSFVFSFSVKTTTAADFPVENRFTALSQNPEKFVTRGGSNVIQVFDKRSSEDSETTRLCHLTNILPLSDGEGQPQKQNGLYSAGAAMLAMMHFNNRTDSVVPEMSNESLQKCDIKLTMEFQDSKFSPIAANRVLLEDLLVRNHSINSPRPVSLVGSFRSAVTGPLSIMSTVNGIPIMSSSSTSSQLDNKESHGLLGRTIPTDAGLAFATVHYLRDVLNVTHCGVLFIRDSFGTAYHADFTRAAFALDPPMVVASASYDTGENELQSIQAAMRHLSESNFNYFFGVTSPPTHDSCVQSAVDTGIIGPGKFWMFADGASKLLGKGFTYDMRSKAEIARATSGVGIMQMDIIKNDAFDKAWAPLEEKNSDLKKRFVSQQPSHIDLSNFAFTTPTFWEYLHYDAVMAIGIAACEQKKLFFDGFSLYESMRNISFTGASGMVVFDPTTGTRDATKMAYKLTTVVSKEGGNSDKMAYEVKDVSKQVVTSSGVKEWTQLAPTVYADGSTASPDVLPPVTVDMNLLTGGIQAVGVTLCASVMVLSIVCMIWTLVNRKSRVVQCSQWQYLILLCLGAFIMACTVIPMALQEPVSQDGLNIACMATPWLFQLGFVFSFSALVSKTSLNRQIYNQLHAYLETIRLRRMRNTKQIQRAGRLSIASIKAIIPLVSLFLVNAAILVAWTIISPQTYYRTPTGSVDSYGRSTESYGHCHSQHQTTFLGLTFGLDSFLLALAISGYCWTRNVTLEYKERFYLIISMVAILQAFAIGLPTLMIATTPEAVFITRSVLLTAIGLSVLLPMFIPKERARKKEVARNAELARASPPRQSLQEAWSSLINQVQSELTDEQRRKVQGSDGGDFLSSLVCFANNTVLSMLGKNSGDFDEVCSPEV